MRLKKKECIRIYKNKIPIKSIISKGISIQLHIPLLQIEFGSKVLNGYNVKVTEEFTKKFENALKETDKKSTCEALFEEYGNFIAQRIEIGGALLIEHKSSKSYKEDIEIL
ncbi:hypothetical protein C2G38_2118510, partial [Gigaspora rosea]